MHLSITPLNQGWDFAPPGGGTVSFGVQDSTSATYATFLDPNHDGSYERYAGDGATLNPDVVLHTLNILGFPELNNQYVVYLSLDSTTFSSSHAKLPVDISFKITGSLTPINDTPTPKPNLHLSFNTSQANPTVGQPYNFDVLLENKGDGVGSNNVVKIDLNGLAVDTLPDGCTGGGLSFTCTANQLAVGAQTVWQISAKTVTEKVSISGTVSSTESDADFTDNKASFSTTLATLPTPASHPNLAVTINAKQTTAFLNNDFAFDVVADNKGQAAGNNTVIRITLDGATLDTLPAGCVDQPGNNNYTSGFICSVNQVAAGASVSIAMVVKPTRVGSFTITAGASSTETDTDAHDNNASLSPNAIHQTVLVALQISAIGLFVDPMIPKIIPFYQQYGFLPADPDDHSRTEMWLPIKTCIEVASPLM